MDLTYLETTKNVYKDAADSPYVFTGKQLFFWK